MIADPLGGVRWTILEGDCLDILSTLPPVDVCLTDPPYSAHVHGKSRAGARKTPLRDGNGRLSRCAIDRAVDFGFAHIEIPAMRAVAAHCARLVRRWSLYFCDVESSHLWVKAAHKARLDYCRTIAWVKVGATPQFTGDRAGVAFETIVAVHPKGRKRWNGGGSLGLHEFTDDVDGDVPPAVLKHLTCIDRGSPGSSARVHPTQKPIPLMLGPRQALQRSR